MAGAKKKSYVPALLPVQVCCDQKHVLTGLFVVYKALFKDRVVEHYRKLWDLHQRLRCELVPELPEDQYTLALSNRQGMLTLVDDQDPWIDFYAGKSSPHQPKLAAGAYRCYFVRHPSVEQARKLRDWLNGSPNAELDADRPAFKDVQVTLERGARGRQLVLRADEDPKSYWPRGPASYGAWTLYRDMPNERCAPVRDAIEKLQAHLGAFRYPVGVQESPYLPKKPEQLSFDADAWSSTLAFQSDHRAGRAWKVADREKCHGSLVQLADPFDFKKATPDDCARSSWAYLDAHAISAAEQQALSSLVVEEDGVVGAKTAAAIRHWLEHGYRKPGMVLVDVDPNEGGVQWHLWMRWPTAMRVKAWREVIKTMGADCGLRAGHSFRSATHEVKSKSRGSIGMSLHKAGMAIDLGVHGSEGKQEDYSQPVAEWPIVFERKIEPGRKRDRIVWRLYARSTIDVDQLDWVASLGKELEKASAALSDHYAKRIGLKNYGGHKEIEVVVDSIRKSCDELIKELADHEQQDPAAAPGPTGAAAFVSKFFRGAVRQWHYDSISPEGGKPGREQRPNEPIKLEYLSPASRTTVRGDGRYRSFLNLTALGYRLGLLRIGAQRTGHQDESVDAHGETVYSSKQVIDAAHPAHFGYIVGRLERLSQDPRHRDGEVLTESSRRNSDGTIDETVSVFNINRLDLDLMDRWARLLGKAAKIKSPIAMKHHGATVHVLLTVPSKAAQLRAFAERLANDFGDTRFKLTDGIHFTWGKLKIVYETGLIQTGREWSETITKVLKQLEHELVKKPGELISKKKAQEDWTLDLHPLFVKDDTDHQDLFAEPDQKIWLPASGTARALEWWHYQDRDATAGNETWIQMMEALGYSRNALGKETSMERYYRPGLGYPSQHRPAKRDSKGRIIVREDLGWDFIPSNVDAPCDEDVDEEQPAQPDKAR